MTTQTQPVGSSDIITLLATLPANGTEVLSVARVIDVLLDARGLTSVEAVHEVIDQELRSISARPSLVTVEEVSAIVARISERVVEDRGA